MTSPTNPGSLFSTTVGLLILAFGLGVCLAGCGASVVERNTTAASIARIGLDAAAGGVEAVCADVPDSEPDKGRACLRAVETHDAARAAWDVWAAAILVAASEEDETALEILGMVSGPVFHLYGELAEALRAFGVNLPDLGALGGSE